MNFQTILNGILLGGLYASVGLGLSLVLGVLRLVNLAHGELVIGGAYLAYVAQSQLGLDPMASLALVVPALALLAYPIQRLVFQPLLARSFESPLVATFGMALIAQGVFAQAFTTSPKALDAAYGNSGVSLLGATVQTIYVIAFGAAITLACATHLLLTRTRFGTAVRAASADPAAAAAMGVNVESVYAKTFAIAAALAAVSGVIIGVAFSMTPAGGSEYLIKGFTVVVLGGVGSPLGTVAAGVIVGLIEGVGGNLAGSEYRDLLVYGVFLALLLVRPTGLFGRRT
jgi:branched-chain amino acid transport system permease protein